MIISFSIHIDKLQPYWLSIVRSMAEVVIENKFPAYPANQKRPDGIVLTTHYWDEYGKKGFLILFPLRCFMFQVYDLLYGNCFRECQIVISRHLKLKNAVIQSH